MTSPMAFNLLLMVFIAIGLSAWAFSSLLTSEVEPWDGFLYLGVIAFSFLLGMVIRCNLLSAFAGVFLGVWIGQIIAIAFVPHLNAQQQWLPLLVITTGIGSLNVSVAFMLGMRSRQEFRGLKR